MKILFAFYDPVPEWENLGSQFRKMQIVFAKDIDVISKEITDTDALFILAPNYTSEVAALVKSKAEKLSWIQATTVGVDEILFNGIPPGVVLTKAVGIFDINVAEQVLALILGIGRRIAASAIDKQKHQYNRSAQWNKVTSLERKNVGIIGYGGIGKQVGKRIKSFDTRVLVYDVVSGVEDEYVDQLFLPGRFEEFLGQCDVIILTLPLTKDNVYMFDTHTFRLMKPSSILINVSRGKLVRESALVEALKEGIIAGAGLDVFEEEPLPQTSELWKLENVVMTPHLGGQGDYNRQRLADLFRVNIDKYLKGEKMNYVVDISKGF